ncbi:MAG: universal stress protein [Chloroflexi bacterium]|nr:universal stress protein [Chloroflexota bacterium]
MFERILCVMDCFEGAQVSLAHLEEFKRAGTQEVVVLGVISLDGCGWTGRNLEECRLDQFDRERAGLEVVLKEIEKGSVKGKMRIEVGTSTHTILKAADEENISLIVMGTGSGSVKGLLLGRTTTEVVKRAKVPVLIMR